MGEYKSPFTITNKILSYVSSVSEKIGRITATSNLEAKPHLRRNNRIKSIHSSLKIEANSLSLSEVRDVINGNSTFFIEFMLKQIDSVLEEIAKIKDIYKNKT